MQTINAIRLLLAEKIISPRQAARMAVRYLDADKKGREITSASSRKERTENPFICPTCKQEVLPF